MPLRPYQIECLEAIRSNHAEGVSRQLVVLPTGGGKTVCFGNLPHYLPLKHGEQLMVIVHRIELVNQTAKRLASYNPTLSVGIEMSKEQASPMNDIVVASVQTIGSDGNKRIQKFDPARLKYLIADECHHILGSTYTNILKYFRVYKPEPSLDDPSKLLLGVTATPNRSDNTGLEAIFDKIVFSRDIREMVADGWLVDIRAFRVETTTDLNGVAFKHGDFKTGELEAKVNTPERNKLIVDKYRELGKGQPGIAFTVDVAHSHDLAACFRANGILAMPLSGSTPDDERKRLLDAYKNGQIAVLISCAVLSEGVDVPQATVGLMARPTASNLLFQQQIGRLLRPWPAPEDNQPPSKKHAIIIDFVDSCIRHKLVTVPTLFGLRADFDMRGAAAVKTVEELEKLQEDKQLSLGVFRSVAELKSAIEAIDLLAVPSVPEAVRGLSRFAWLSAPSGFRLSIPGRIVFSVREDTLGKFEVRKHVDGCSQTVYSNVDTLQQAITRADGLVPADAKKVLLVDAGWRSEEPTDKQIQALARLDKAMVRRFGSLEAFTTFMKSSFNRGQVSQMIGDRQR